MIKVSLIIGNAENKADKIVRNCLILDIVLNGRNTLNALNTLRFIELLPNIIGMYANNKMK